MDMTEGVIRACAQAVCGTTQISYNGQPVDLGKPFDRFTIVGAIQHYNPDYTDAQLADADWLKGEIQRLGKAAPGAGPGQPAAGACLKNVPKVAVGTDLIIDYPVEVSPLARASDSNPASPNASSCLWWAANWPTAIPS